MQKDSRKPFDMGARYQKNHTNFRLWAPTADAVSLRMFERGDGDCLLMEIPMEKEAYGIWSADVPGDKNHTYYSLHHKNTHLVLWFQYNMQTSHQHYRHNLQYIDHISVRL